MRVHLTKRLLAIAAVLSMSATGYAYAGPRKILTAVPVQLSVTGTLSIPPAITNQRAIYDHGLRQVLGGTITTNFSGSGQAWYALSGSPAANSGAFFVVSGAWNTPRTLPAPLVQATTTVALVAQLVARTPSGLRLVTERCQFSAQQMVPLEITGIPAITAAGVAPWSPNNRIQLARLRFRLPTTRPVCARISRLWSAVFTIGWPSNMTLSEAARNATLMPMCYANFGDPNVPLCYGAPGSAVQFSTGASETYAGGVPGEQTINVVMTFGDPSQGNPVGIPSQAP